tara:strand:- start:1361 stop:1759 length:399 start_codon:yes stop_codon:yes gene_type:complete
MKYFKDSKGNIYVDPIESKYTDLIEMTAEAFDAEVVIRNTPPPPTAKEARDSGLDLLVHDFGDGRVMQVRLKDEQFINGAIELMELSGKTSMNDWVMEDNKKYTVTVDELKAGRLTGLMGVQAAFATYEPQG